MNVSSTFRNAALVVAVLATTQIVAAADDLKVFKLEQDVLELQRVVQQQARRIDSLESGLRQSRTSAAPPADRLPAGGIDDPKSWLRIANWEKLRVGMSETEAIQILGAPTTTRMTQGEKTRTLFYALELEAGGFLSGQVIVADRRVVEVRKPELK